MKKFRIACAVLLASGIWLSCSEDNPTSPGESGTGILKVSLTDAPAAYDQVNVTFTQVAVHAGSAEDTTGNSADSTSGWIILSDTEQTFDLLTLNNGASALLGEAELAAGHYTQLRLELASAEVVNDSVSYPLTIPSGTLKFVSGFDVTADSTTQLLVDFDAARSIHQTGKGQYKLKPTIRIINQSASGEIVGTVTNYQNRPVAYAIAGTDTVTTTTVNPDNGKFTLSGLAGTYAVSVVDTLNKSYQNPSVPVAAGQEVDLGAITLQ